MLRKHTLKYLGIKECDICNSLSDALGRGGKCIHFFELVFECVLKFSSKFEISLKKTPTKIMLSMS